MSKRTRHILAASLAGTSIEFFDFYIYATAASLVFGSLFFPKVSVPAQLMAAYATFALAFVARPLGAVVFGHFGDRIGRKSTLVSALLLMGGSTVAIGFLPTYQLVGWLAPLMLCVLRFGQGFGLGGEWGGAALLAVENAPRGYRARYGMFPPLGAPLGFFAANAVFLLLGLLLPKGDFITFGWRLPFIGSAALVWVGLWVRLKLTETPDFKRALEQAPPSAVPMFELLRDYPREVTAGLFAVVGCFALFYLTTVFALGYATKTLGYDRDQFLAVQLLASACMAGGIVISGYWADRSGTRFVLMLGSVAIFASGLLYAPALQSGSLVIVTIYLCAAQTLMGIAYGPLGAWLPSLFPPRVRYTGVSIAFNTGGILGGAVTPILAESLARASGGLLLVGAYLCLAAVVSFSALAGLRKQGLGVFQGR